jgi:flagellar M-ring protein FliF
MEQLKKLYRSLSPGQRSGIVAAVAVTLAVLGLLRWQAAANFKPLYTSLSPEDAGAVVEKLKERSVAYQIADNGATILVPSESIAESRLEMALSGLPKSGRIGFELFDRTNLGVTDFAEHINYQRALEGELERSVMSLSEVEQARVHITLAKDSVFTQSREPAKASVLLKLRPGVTLAPRSVIAISHLVAAAVEGLTPPAVSVVDMNGNLLSSPKSRGLAETAESTDSFLEYRQSMEKSLVDKINETLEPLLGPGRFRAGVSVECDFTRSEQNEELFNPEQSVVTSSHVTEESTGGPGGAAGGSGGSGIPGTASALPRPRPETGPAGNGVTRRSENTTYQASRTVRHTTTPQGSVKKISAAVLVDYILEREGEGDKQTRKLLARAPDKIDAIRELVSAAIGLDASRGDQLIVQTMPFETTLQLQNQDLEMSAPGAGASPSQKILDRLQQEPLLMVAAGAAVLLLLGAAMWMMRRLRKKPAAALQKGPPALAAGLATGHSGQLGEQEGAARVAQPYAAGDLAAPRAMQVPQLLSPRHDVLVREVQEIVNKDTELSAGIIHGWLVEEAQQ